MFKHLDRICEKPSLYCSYTAESLWNDPYISQQMLKYHLDPSVDLASRKPEFIKSSLAFIQERFKLGKGKSVIDFGCGPGLYTSAWAQLGCKVRGLDFSLNSINYAKEEAARSGLNIDYHYINYLDYQGREPFDLVTMIFCDYSALNPDQRKSLLSIMRDSLNNDGHIFMDVPTEQMYKNMKESTSFEIAAGYGFWSQQRHYIFQSNFKYDTDRVGLDKYTIIEVDRTFEIFNWFKYFTISELSNELAANGLELVEVYSDLRGIPFSMESNTMAVVAGKKG
ncbi:putative sam-dependent methyltransferase [hydrocarbon metagenome]|uniref:Putative sam-dependent methyltransferase n=1 Tax=hydrocarbon metagenome TaxID=938273 RepID=A0A0W8E7Q5_9ZZZZ